MPSIKFRSTYAGVAVMSSGTKTVTVTHGIGSIPTVVIPTWQSVMTANNTLWVESMTSTTFVIRALSNVPAAKNIGWLAVV